jgi:fatty acid-binding protein DegV
VIIKALANLRKNGRIEKNEGLVSEMAEFDKKMAELTNKWNRF